MLPLWPRACIIFKVPVDSSYSAGSCGPIITIATFLWPFGVQHRLLHSLLSLSLFTLLSHTLFFICLSSVYLFFPSRQNPHAQALALSPPSISSSHPSILSFFPSFHPHCHVRCSFRSISLPFVDRPLILPSFILPHSTGHPVSEYHSTYASGDTH